MTKGYDRVSLDEIVQAAGGSKTNIYAFYGGKEGLFLAAIAHACKETLAPFLSLDLAGLTLEHGLARLGQELLNVLLEPRHVALFRLVIGETGRFPQLGAAWHAGGPSMTRGKIRDFLLQHMPRGQGAGRAEELARQFHDMAVQDLLQRALFEPAPASCEERRRIVGAAAAMVAHALVVQPV